MSEIRGLEAGHVATGADRPAEARQTEDAHAPGTAATLGLPNYEFFLD